MTDKIVVLNSNVYKRSGTKKYWYWIKFIRYSEDGTDEKDELRESSGSANKMVATQKLRERINEFTSVSQPHKIELSVNTLIDNYITHYKIKKKIRPKIPLPDWLTPVLKDLRKHFGHIPAEKIKPSHIKNYIQKNLGYYNPKKTKEIKAPGTIEKNLTFFNAIYNEAWRKNLISEKALKVVKHRTRLEADVRQEFMEYHHFEEIYEKLIEPLKLPFKICYMYGLRKRECLNLEWDDINLKRGTVRIPKTKTKVPRTIYVDDEIKEELREHHKNNGHSRFVFTQKGKSTPINNNYFYKNFKNALEDCGFEEKFIWHDTRRSAIRELVRSGVPENTAMKISGHKSRSVFERYNIVSEADLKIGAEMRRKYFEEQKDSQPWRVD